MPEQVMNTVGDWAGKIADVPTKGLTTASETVNKAGQDLSASPVYNNLMKAAAMSVLGYGIYTAGGAIVAGGEGAGAGATEGVVDATAIPHGGPAAVEGNPILTGATVDQPVAAGGDGLGVDTTDPLGPNNAPPAATPTTPAPSATPGATPAAKPPTGADNSWLQFGKQAAATAVITQLLIPKPKSPQAPDLSKTPVTEMPDPLAQEQARKKSLIAQIARRGRTSTILTNTATAGGRLG